MTGDFVAEVACDCCEDECYGVDGYGLGICVGIVSLKGDAVLVAYHVLGFVRGITQTLDKRWIEV